MSCLYENEKRIEDAIKTNTLSFNLVKDKNKLLVVLFLTF